MQGFTGTLRGNEPAGVSNLQGLQVAGNACKKFQGKPLKSAGDMFYTDNVGETLHHLQCNHVITVGKVCDKIDREIE